MIRDLKGNQRGSVTLLVAGGMVGFLGLTALAVDVGSAYLNARALQGAADAAALAAAGNPAAAQSAATATLRDNGWTTAVAQVQQGSYARDPAVPVASRFTAGGASPEAARVTVTAQAPLRFAGALIGRNSLTIVRRATAMRISQASFSIGTRIASLDGGVANALLSQLAGGAINLSVGSYTALLGADVSLFSTLDALRTRLNLTGATYDQLLAANVTVPVLLRSVADALTQSGQGTAAAALNQVAAAAAARPLQTKRLIDLGPLWSRTSVSGAQINLAAWDLAQAAIALAGGPRQVAINISSSLAPLATATLYYAQGERPAQSPWLTVTSNSTAVVRTAQSRLYVNLSLDIAGLIPLLPVSATLPVYAELGSAEARLSALSCPTSNTALATLAVTPSLGHVSIKTIANPTTALGNFNQSVTENPVDIVNVLNLIRVGSNARINLGGTTAQMLTFSRADVNAGTIRSVSTNDLTSGVVHSLLDQPDALTLPLGTNLLLGVVKLALTPLVPLLDGVLTTVMGLVGLHVGQADVRVNGIRCGQPTLVA